MNTKTNDAFKGRDSVLIPKAVIGLVDIVGSTDISNVLGLDGDWSLKQAFFASATRRAVENGIEILNHTGDGFVFLVGTELDPGWQKMLVRFHRELVSDFAKITVKAQLSKLGLSTGLRLGVAAGPILLGTTVIGQVVAVGMDINLASRLCAAAAPGEMVLSENVREMMATELAGNAVREVVHAQLKGFEREIVATHVSAGSDATPEIAVKVAVEIAVEIAVAVEIAREVADPPAMASLAERQVWSVSEYGAPAGAGVPFALTVPARQARTLRRPDSKRWHASPRKAADLMQAI